MPLVELIWNDPRWTIILWPYKAYEQFTNFLQ